MTDAPTPETSPDGSQEASPSNQSARRRAWVAFASGLEVFNIAIIYSIFAPYFIATVTGDPAEGQALWGYAAGLGGLAGALLAPPLGFAAEAPQRRRRFLFIALMANAVPAFVLALAVPGVSGFALFAVLAALALTTAANDINYMLLGGMLAEVAPSRIMGRTSSAAVSVGWTIGIGVALAYMAAFIMFDPFHLELDASRGEAERLVGPVAGGLMLLLCAPLILLRSPSRAAPPKRSWRVWLKQETASLLSERTIAIAVGARLVYWSGVTLLGLFGAGLARATFDWDTLTTGVFGLTVLAFGALGAVTGGRLDDRVGSRNALIIYLLGLAVAMSGLLAISPDRIFFVIDVAPRAPDAGMMSSPAEWTALALGALSGFFVGPTGPISRTLVARLAPPDRRGRYFGVAALAGNSTNAFGPFLVAVLTDMAHDQRIGLLVAPVLLVAGAGVLTLLPSARTVRGEDDS